MEPYRLAQEYLVGGAVSGIHGRRRDRVDETGASTRTEDDAPAVRVVGADGYPDFVSEHDADSVLAHLSREVGEHFVVFVDEHTERAATQDLGHSSVEFNKIVFAHSYSVSPAGGSARAYVVGGDCQTERGNQLGEDRWRRGRRRFRSPPTVERLQERVATSDFGPREGGREGGSPPTGGSRVVGVLTSLTR